MSVASRRSGRTAPVDDVDGSAPLLRLSDVRVARDGILVVDGVDVTVHPGEIVALLGGNGSGKSTLIKAALGLLPTSGGQSELLGTPVRGFRDWRRVGYVPQRSSQSLRGATVREVVAAGRLAHRPPFVPLRKVDRAAIAQALGEVHLGHRAKEELVVLSGGQQQRALIARALAGNPSLLIMDEPFAGVDLRHQQTLSDALARRVLDGMGVLVVLHETGPLHRLIDRAIVLESGRVAHDGEVPTMPDHHDGHEDEPPTIGKILHGVVDPEDTLA